VTRLLRLLFVLIASSLVVTATVHAREQQGSAVIECSGFVHTDGDADQSQGDADKSIPHHHGSCQGTVMQVPAKYSLPAALHDAGLRPIAGADQILASGSVEPGLRPPNA
jgi:hypothetical protein|tara:strand:+ start:1139 stop:1468 length:330 start_codon:yes stop_codon:yes gene_type:complete